MEHIEKDGKDSATRLLSPIDPSYQPARSITKIPATSSIDEILAVIERDGGVILTDFVSMETLDNVDKDLAPYLNPNPKDDSYNNFIGKKTLVIAGLVGKSDTLADLLDTNETLDKLLKIILEETYPAVFEEHTEELVIDPLLSISLGFYVSEGSPRQALHRDDMIFASKIHRPDMKINEVDGFSCFIAGSNITRENGGTMVILGSHKWEHDRRGKPEEVSFLGKLPIERKNLPLRTHYSSELTIGGFFFPEMKRGSAFIFLSTMAHGAGYNTIPGETRKILNLVFCRGTLRTEENQFLCNPRSKVLKMSPKLQTLLGFKKPDRNWLGMVENEDPTKDLAAVYEKMLA